MEKTDTGIAKAFGFYRGKVKQHGPFGQCKIFWYGVNPIEWENLPDMLPWAEQASPLFGAANDTDGLFFYPDVESTVWGFFQDGNVNYPVYFASCLGVGANESAYTATEANKESAKEGMEANKTAVLQLGKLKITFNGKEGEGKNVCYKLEGLDSTIEISDDGISIDSKKNISVSSSKDIDIKAKGSLRINGTMLTEVSSGGETEAGTTNPGEVDIYGGKLKINSFPGIIQLVGGLLGQILRVGG